MFKQLRYQISRTIAYLLPDKLYLSIKFRTRMGYWMDWNNPKTFCEKIQWLKVYNKHKEYTEMVDKYAAKEYVSKHIGSEYIIPTIGIFKSVDEINFSTLPNQFVLKCTHDSGGLVVCKDKANLNIKSVKNKLRKGLKRTYVVQNREYPYKNVPRRIIAEQYLQTNSGSDLIDYKFFCFNGKAEYCQVIANRSTDESIDFYDRNWKHQEFIGLLPTAHHAPTAHHMPKNYDKMLEIADKLASDIPAPFVRIDLYNIVGKIYFGEITFFPATGMGVFRPSEWDLRLGELIRLPKQDLL